jgi:hypothetical protein
VVPIGIHAVPDKDRNQGNALKPDSNGLVFSELVQDAHFDRILTARRNETNKKAYFDVPILSEPFKTEPEVDAAIDAQINSLGVDGWD